MSYYIIKKTISILAAVTGISCFSLAGCGKEMTTIANQGNQEPVVTTEPTETPSKEEITVTPTLEVEESVRGRLLIAGDLSEQKEISTDELVITEKANEDSVKGDHGEILLTISTKIPVVTISGNEEASNLINQSLNEIKDAAIRSKEEYVEIAKEDYATKPVQDQQYWGGYGMYLDYAIGRADSGVISFRIMDSRYTGGAHPNTAYFGVSYDVHTGKQLLLENIATDADAFKKEVEDACIEIAKNTENKEVLFEDYAQYMGDLLNEDTWWLTENGLIVIVNPYLISSYAAGTLYFEIPYSQLKYFNTQYCPD